MTPLFSDEPGWESGREVQDRIAARLGRVAEEERKQQRAKRAAVPSPEHVCAVERQSTDPRPVAEGSPDHRRGRGGCRGGDEEALQTVEHELLAP